MDYVSVKLCLHKPYDFTMESDSCSIVSFESDDVDEMFDYVDQENEEKVLTRKRNIKLAFILMMFLISLTLLTLSVLHDVKAESVTDEGEELDFVCPPGMSWCVTMARCMVEKGYYCCPTCSHEYKCSKSEGEMKCCYLLGIMPSSYKLSCRPGWVWLEWGQRCVRGDTDIG